MKTLPLLLIAEGRRARPRKAPVARPKESVLHIAVANTLRAHCLPEWQWWHTPNGEARNIITGARLKRYGVRRGIPDLVLINPAGLFHGLELKRHGETLTDDQAEFQLWCIRHGIPYSVAYSLDQALAFLDALGCLRITIGGAR
jgi:hypothetical protein